VGDSTGVPVSVLSIGKYVQPIHSILNAFIQLLPTLDLNQHAQQTLIAARKVLVTVQGNMEKGEWRKDRKGSNLPDSRDSQMIWTQISLVSNALDIMYSIKCFSTAEVPPNFSTKA
jgi:hypothetical protein